MGKHINKRPEPLGRPSIPIDEPLFSQREMSNIVKMVQKEAIYNDRVVAGLRHRLRNLIAVTPERQKDATRWSETLGGILRDRAAGMKKATLSDGELIELREWMREMAKVWSRALKELGVGE